MPTYKPDLILQSECARRAKVTAQAVSGWIKTGKLKAYIDKNGRTKVDWNKAKHIEPMRPLAQRTVFLPDDPEALAGAEPEPGFLDLARAKLKRETFLAHAAELEYNKAAGELVSAADVAKQWEGIAANVRRRLLVLPDRLAPLVAAELDPRKVHAMITKELHQCLTTLDQAPEEMESENGSDEHSEPGENS